ncbi:MAG: Wzz/FepE/Etk N-terminal domain-containing protein [Pseudonocardiaceae bacterium]
MTNTSASSLPEPLLDLQRLVAGLRWRRRIWMSLGLLGLLAGALLAVLVPPPSTAVARILITHENDQESVSGSLMETDIALLETTRIAAATLQRIEADERPEDFLKSYSGEGLTGNILELTVRAPSDQDAVIRAQALADTFIADHLQRTEAAANAETQALIDRRDQAEAELARVDDSIAGTAEGTAELEALYVRRAELAGQIQELGARAQEAGSGAPRVVAGTQLVDSPRAITGSPLVAAVMYAAVGLILGLGAGLALAAVTSVVADRPVLRRDIAAHLGASVIAQLPAPRRGPARLWRRSSSAQERKRVAATLVRAVHDDPGAVSLLELGCPRTAAALALDIAEELAGDRPVVVIDGLPGRHLRSLAGKTLTRKAQHPIRILDGAERPAGGPSALPQPERRLGVGSVGPGAAWTDLRQLGSETLLVVRAGHSSALWLHTVARQLADARIPVIGVVLVHPDPRDRSDGTLWDALHTALRGRERQPASSTSPAELPTVGSTTTTTEATEAS